MGGLSVSSLNITRTFLAQKKLYRLTYPIELAQLPDFNWETLRDFIYSMYGLEVSMLVESISRSPGYTRVWGWSMDEENTVGCAYLV